MGALADAELDHLLELRAEAPIASDLTKAQCDYLDAFFEDLREGTAVSALSRRVNLRAVMREAYFEAQPVASYVPRPGTPPPPEWPPRPIRWP